jgi:hypothetical protein
MTRPSTAYRIPTAAAAVLALSLGAPKDGPAQTVSGTIVGTAPNLNFGVQPAIIKVFVENESAPRTVTTDANGRYSVDVPAGARIERMEFTHPRLHYFEVKLLQEIGTGNVIHKVMTSKDGIRGYDRNMDQLLEYEKKYYRDVAFGRANDELPDLIAGLQKMPRPGFPQLANLTPLQVQLLEQKRREVFRLYRLPYVSPAQTSAIPATPDSAIRVPVNPPHQCPSSSPRR